MNLLLLTGVSMSALWSQVKNRSGSDSTIFISNTVFLPDFPFRSGAQNWDLLLTNVDRDTLLEVVSLDRKTSKIWVHQSDGKGDLGSKKAFPAVSQGRALIAIPGKAQPDLAVVNIRGQVQILSNDGNGQFSGAQVLKAGRLGQGLTARIHPQSGKPEILVAGLAEAKVFLFQANAEGRYKAEAPFPTGRKPRTLALGDI
ncbi:MAG: hypothetical protein AAFV07_15390, partial [Bacteroidota bacterium]